MKIKLLPILLITCTCLSGCVSSTKYNELEKRVEELEAKSLQQPSDELYDSVSDKEPIQNYTYYIDDLSAEETAQECLRIIDGLPSEGHFLDEYIDGLKGKPISIPALPDNYSDEPVILDFTYVEKIDPPIIADKDAIVCITINGMESEMDGSVRYATYKTGDISVDVDIVDYDKASAVYDKLLDTIREPFLTKLSFHEGTHWSATGNTEDDEWFDYLDLRKYENGYRLRIDIPIKH